MTFHDKRLQGSRAKRGSPAHTYKKLIEGAYTITLWPTLRMPTIGDVSDDWRSVGADLRKAMREEA